MTIVREVKILDCRSGTLSPDGGCRSDRHLADQISSSNVPSLRRQSATKTCALTTIPASAYRCDHKGSGSGSRRIQIGAHFAAWVGLTPRPHSSGGKERLGGISKMGNPELRVLLVLGATAVLRIARNDDRARPWLKALLARRRSRWPQSRWPTRWPGSFGRF